MQKKLTPREKKAYDFLVGYIKTNGYAPTDTEIGNHLGLSRQSGAQLLTFLQHKGYSGDVKVTRYIEIL